ncbi:MAG: ABC transporter ATP-binding protein [Chloroflexota bacterium]|nr:ABC transporter ATP-binding protein [Chloroflexota bacterium]
MNDRSGAEPILEVRNLKTHFFTDKGVVKAVKGVSFSLANGQTLGIVGESGCGKSVTAHSIMQLIKSPPGEIVEGEIVFRRQKRRAETIDIVQLDPKGVEMRSIRGGEISMIFQEPMTSLNPLHTVGRQISEVVELHQGLGKKEALKVAIDMLDRVRIADPQERVKQYPHQLSGGMRQRVMIALALSCNPSILIADEPTTALDVTIQAQIIDLMEQLQEDFGSSIIIITHNLGVVSQMADYVAVMYFGRVVEYGTAIDIFRDPQHPYTVGLLQSIPVLGRRKDILVPIEGIVPNAIADIPGCAFAERCPHVMEKCRQHLPPTTTVDGEHQVACWLHEPLSA